MNVNVGKWRENAREREGIVREREKGERKKVKESKSIGKKGEKGK